MCQVPRVTARRRMQVAVEYREPLEPTFKTAAMGPTVYQVHNRYI
jgi:hypothetical protein